MPLFGALRQGAVQCTTRFATRRTPADEFATVEPSSLRRSAEIDGENDMRMRTDGLTWQEIDGELVILDLVGSVYLTTNGSGAFLAKLLTEERSEPELAEALVAQYDIDTETASADVAAFVAQLSEKKLLVES